ncbi:hypothetical protein BGZ63DRAFT_518955 [Mariannaea sp. PMI_226]|nr:hypothetical protein BGZ63DRAFT_518955 [Mariannaea sp. PMI_226]
MTRIFLTGATGYIGGDALYNVVEKHPDYHITALVRSKEKGQLVRGRFPSVDLVYGDLDDFNLLADQVSKADITCHWASCEHEGAAKAIAEGFSRKPAHTAGFVIHLSGSDIVCSSDITAGTYGEERDEIFTDDDDGLDKVLTPTQNAPHQEVDLTIIEAGKKGGKTAIVCPSAIFGLGRGPGNTRSIQVPELASHILQRKYAFSVGQGKNVWSSVHIHDVSNLFLLLVEAAAQGGGSAAWGAGGFYFVENGELSWTAASRKIAEVALKQGLLESTDVECVNPEEADKIWPYSTAYLGTNSRVRSIRARKILGWTPVGGNIFADIPAVVAAEAKTLKLA